MAGMPTRRKRWGIVGAAIAIALATAWWVVWPDVTSAALLLDLAEPGSRIRAALPVRVAPVRESDLSVPTRHGDVEGRLHVPHGGSTRVLLIVPGVHAGGIHEPRLAALSRRVAGAGATVLTLPLPDLRTYRITPESTDQIEDAITWLSARTDLAPTGRIGVIGVSFAGGLALAAAGRPGVSERLTAVVSLGGHADLPRAMAYACTGRLPDGTIRTPHDYGTVLALRAAVPHLVPADQVAPLDRALVTFLDASSYATYDMPRGMALLEDARRQEEALPEPARTLMHFVTTRDVVPLGARIAPFVEALGGHPSLSPARSPATRAPVFILHGELDNVIPTPEAAELVSVMARAGNTNVRMLVTPLVTHAAMQSDFAWSDGWRLVRFWTKAWKGLTTDD
jgi:dienelactone hydrolase